jgi:hypothetical protein
VELVKIEMKNVAVPSRPMAAPEHTAVQETSESVPVEREPHHRWIFENQYVRALDVVLAPGESTLFHTHSHDSIAVTLTDAKLQEQPLNKEWRPTARLLPGNSRYMQGTRAPYTHRIKNVGSTPFHVIDIELLATIGRTSEIPTRGDYSEAPAALIALPAVAVRRGAWPTTNLPLRTAPSHSSVTPDECPERR